MNSGGAGFYWIVKKKTHFMQYIVGPPRLYSVLRSFHQSTTEQTIDPTNMYLYLQIKAGAGVRYEARPRAKDK